MLDAEWIAQLLQHGLLRGSVVPPAPIRDLRECTRYRKQLIRARADEANRLQKLLETANLKLGSVATARSQYLRRAVRVRASSAGSVSPKAMRWNWEAAKDPSWISRSSQAKWGTTAGETALREEET
jgi:transposase